MAQYEATLTGANSYQKAGSTVYRKGRAYLVDEGQADELRATGLFEVKLVKSGGSSGSSSRRGRSGAASEEGNNKAE